MKGSERPRGRGILRRTEAFTIIELLAATAILGIILVVVFGITQQTANAWKRSTAKIEAFQGARAAFQAMTSQLSQATLNTYWDYYDSGGNRRTSANASTFVPVSYGRASDLQLVSGKSLLATSPKQITHAVFFQTPAGYTDNTSYDHMDTLLNACGYYVIYDKDPDRPAFINGLGGRISNDYRYRLMQFLQPSQNLAVYDSGYSSNGDWFKKLVTTTGNVRQQAANVLALVVLPRLSEGDAGSGSGAAISLASDYEYDTLNSSNQTTFNQLPPVVEVVMVAMDEPSAQRICKNSTEPLGLLAGTLFQKASKLDADLDTLVKQLDGQRVGYRIFRTLVVLRGSKWSSS